MSENSSIIFAVTPIFMNRNEAGRYLGHSDDWLRERAKEHDLFKPSAGGGAKGARCMYHIDHLAIIARHMLAEDVFPRDLALAAWEQLQQTALRRLTEAITIGVRKTSK